MIIFGTRGITYSKGNGDFHCPQCNSKHAYKHRRVRRFFTLYFIPLIPLDLHGEYVECQQCKGTFRLEVLDLDPHADAAEFEAEYHNAIKRVMVLMMLADGEIDAEEVATLRKIYAQLAGSELSEADIHSEIDQVHSGQHDLTSSLDQCAGYLNNDGKEMIIRAAFLIAAADGVFHDEEKVLLATIGQSLGMSSAHLKGVISSIQTE